MGFWNNRIIFEVKSLRIHTMILMLPSQLVKGVSDERLILHHSSTYLPLNNGKSTNEVGMNYLHITSNGIFSFPP